jgi:hypothetical protein
MKVKVEFTVEIDRETWELNYGKAESAAEIRSQVRDWAVELLNDQLDRSGLR